MIDPFFTKRISIPSEIETTWSTQGYSSLGVDVEGTFTSGSFVLKGTNDNVTWTTLEMADGSGVVTGGAVDATGHYTYNCLGFNLVKIDPTDLNATVVLSILGTVEVAGIFSGGASGGDIVVDSLTIEGLVSSSLYTDSAGQVEGAPFGNPGDVLEMSATGSLNLVGIVTDGTNLVALASTGAVNRSTDSGATWSTVATGQPARCLFYGNGLFLAGGGAGALSTSSDGITWTARTSGVATNLDCFAWTGSVFVCGGQTATVITSPDGVTWTTRTFGGAVELRSLSWNGSVLVATGANMVKTSDATAVTWTSRTPAWSDTAWTSLWDGAQFIAMGAAGKIATSPTGTTWTSRTSGITTAIYGSLLDGANRIAYGEEAVILTSTDGVTWTPRTSTLGDTLDLQAGCLLSTTSFLVGTAGAVIKSTDDGVTWSLISSPAPVFASTVGTGPALRRDGDKTINGAVTFPTPIRESSILSAPVLATDAEGDHVAGTTTGTGSVVMLAESPTTTGTLTGAAANWSGQVTSTSDGGGSVSSGFKVSSASAASMAFNVTGTAADNRLWDINTGGSTFSVRAVNDANSAAATAMTITRSGTSITEIAFLAPVSTGSTITTAAPTTGTAAPWKLGTVVSDTVALDTTKYVEVDINGTLVKLAVVT